MGVACKLGQDSNGDAITKELNQVPACALVGHAQY